MYILFAIGAIIVGFVVEVYCFQIVRTFGHLDWAEQRLGPGSTYTVWRIAGIVAILAGFWVLIHGLPTLR